MSESEIAEYVASGEPMDKAGAYAVQGLASRFIPRIEGAYANVVGLPVARLSDLLRDLVDLYDRGLREPLPLPCKTAASWADARRRGRDAAESAARCKSMLAAIEMTLIGYRDDHR